LSSDSRLYSAHSLGPGPQTSISVFRVCCRSNDRPKKLNDSDPPLQLILLVHASAQTIPRLRVGDSFSQAAVTQPLSITGKFPRIL